MEGIIGLLVGYVICKVLAGGESFLSDLFHVSHPSDGPKPLPLPSSTTTVVNFPMAKPEGLPPWPSGWKPVSPVTPGLVERAWALLPTMNEGQVKYEQGSAGTWLAFYKHKFGGKTGVTVHEPKEPVTTAQPPPLVTPAPGVNVSTPPAAPSSGSSRPTLKKGARGEAVKVLQRALGISDDGNFGRDTEKAVKAWQQQHGLSPDGVVGRDTWATLPAAA